MKTRLTIVTLLATLVLSVPGASSATVARDDFGEAVKLIEQFYHVKHQSIPLLAKASMKAATTAARIKGGEYRKLAEAGSVKVVFDAKAKGSYSFECSRPCGAGHTMMRGVIIVE